MTRLMEFQAAAVGGGGVLLEQDPGAVVVQAPPAGVRADDTECGAPDLMPSFIQHASEYSPGVVITVDRRPVSMMAFTVEGELVRSIHAIIDPARLAQLVHPGPNEQ